MENPPALEKFRDQIAHLENHPEDIKPEYLNNMHLWIPGSEYLDQVRPLRSWDQPRGSSLGDGHSDLWHQQSVHQLVDAIAQAIEEIPDSARTLEQIDTERTNINKELSDIHTTLDRRQELLYHKEQLPMKIREALVPVYLALREKGYTHYDLVS